MVSGASEGSDFGNKRVLVDSLKLIYSKIYNIHVTETGSWCSFPYKLHASIDTNGGTWQWYKDSVAIVGATDSVLDITNLEVANYTALYLVNGSCQGYTHFVGPPVFPNIFLTPLDSINCMHDSIYFDAFSYISSGTIDSYTYNFGNGDSAFVESPTYAFDQYGQHTVIRQATSDVNCITTDTFTVEIYEVPSVSFSFNNSCEYDSAEFSNTSTINTGFIDSMFWTIENLNLPDSLPLIYKFEQWGTHPVSLTAISDFGCTSIVEKTIEIHPKPLAHFIAEDDCEYDQTEFIDSSAIASGNIVQYSWLFGDGTTSRTQNPLHIYQNFGLYSTQLSIISDSGCFDTSRLQIEIYPAPTPSFTYENNCLISTFTNTSSIGSGYIDSYFWSLESNFTSTLFEPVYRFSEMNTYQVNLLATSEKGCVADTTVPVVIANILDAKFSLSNQAICSDESVKLFNNSTPHLDSDLSYHWQLGYGQISNKENSTFTFSANSLETQLIDVFFTISSSSGCVDSAFLLDAISVVPLPDAYFSFSPDKPELVNPEVDFTNLSILANNYEWNFGDNNYSTEKDPTHIYKSEAKEYTVTLVASDANNICFDEHSELLIVQDNILFFIPNSFTPNGSGRNDYYSPQFISGIDIYQFRMQIFNRWGEIVFESFDPAGSWDGRYAGNLVQSGTYIWKIDFIESMADKTHPHTGTVNVLR
ncbi:MAG: PKD domain-containing protein [Crocinitomicaceae bacterium]